MATLDIAALVREQIAAAIAEALGSALGSAETFTIGAPRKAAESPSGKRARFAASRKPFHSCTGDEAGTVHGFISREDAGTPCKRSGCTGTIRGEAVAEVES